MTKILAAKNSVKKPLKIADLALDPGRDPDRNLWITRVTRVQGEVTTDVVPPAVLKGAEVVPSLLKRSTTTGPLGGGLSLEIIIPNDRPPQRRPLSLFLLVE